MAEVSVSSVSGGARLRVSEGGSVFEVVLSPAEVEGLVRDLSGLAARPPVPSPADVASAVRPGSLRVDQVMRLFPAAQSWMTRLGFTESDVESALFDPVESWVSESNPKCVLSVGASGVGVVADVSAAVPVVMSVRRSEELPRPTAQKWRKSGGGSHRAARRDVSPVELVEELRRLGVEVSLSQAGHYRAQTAIGSVVIPSTPSDNRWYLNAVADIRRKLAIEVFTEGV